MAYYDALVAEWATLTGTTADKLAAIDALTVAGPNVDVAPAAIVAYLALAGKLAALLKYAAAPPASAAGVAAANLAAVLAMGSNAPSFAMSQPGVYAQMDAMRGARAGAAASGLSAAAAAALLALAATTTPWWRAAGYSSPIGAGDLAAAGGLV